MRPGVIIDPFERPCMSAEDEGGGKGLHFKGKTRKAGTNDAGQMLHCLEGDQPALLTLVELWSCSQLYERHEQRRWRMR